MEATYSALNGKEIRELLKRETCDRIDKIPGLKIGLTFHRAQLHFGFTMEAFPADVPVPEKEFVFQINSDLTKTGENDNHFSKVEILQAKLNNLIEQQTKLEELVEEAEQALASIKLEVEEEIHLDAGNDPNVIRSANKMPIPVMSKTSDGKRVESEVQVSGFNKKDSQKDGYMYNGESEETKPLFHKQG